MKLSNAARDILRGNWPIYETSRVNRLALFELVESGLAIRTKDRAGIYWTLTIKGWDERVLLNSGKEPYDPIDSK